MNVSVKQIDAQLCVVAAKAREVLTALLAGGLIAGGAFGYENALAGVSLGFVLGVIFARNKGSCPSCRPEGARR